MPQSSEKIHDFFFYEKKRHSKKKPAQNEKLVGKFGLNITIKKCFFCTVMSNV
jgi:hypothetical protein